MLLKREFVDSTRGRIVAFLRGGSRTVDEIAAHLRVTKSAVRAQMAAMERDGVVRRAGLRAGTTRPFRVFELTAEAEQLLSKGYVPVVTHLLDVLADTFSSDELDDLLETAGRRLARSLTPARAYPRRRSARALVVS